METNIEFETWLETVDNFADFVDAMESREE
jgi:hypothetical protein